MKVNVMHGSFQKDQNLRNEFLTRLTQADVVVSATLAPRRLV